jgi:hypothetical protein
VFGVVLPSVTTQAVDVSILPQIFHIPQTVDPSVDLDSTMAATTENNEKGLPLEKAETVAEQQDSETDFRLWQQLPVFIAMGLAIFILGLVCSLFFKEVATFC